MGDIGVETFTRNFPRLTNLLGANPECCLLLAVELAGRKLIAFATLESASDRSSVDRALVVLKAVRVAIRDDLVAFGEFLSALEREEILCSVADEMRHEADLPGNATSESAAASPALEPPPTERRKTNGLAMIKTELERRDELQGILEALQDKFCQLIDQVVQHIRQDQLERLFTIITCKLTSPSEDLKDVIQQLRSMSTVKDVFNFLMVNHHCGYLNYNLLKAIAPLYDRRCKKGLKEYEEEYMKFARVANLGGLLNTFQKNPELRPLLPVGIPRVSFILEDRHENRRLHFIHTVMEFFSLAQRMGLTSAERNCITVGFSIFPSDFMTVKDDLADSNKTRFLEEIGIRVQLYTPIPSSLFEQGSAQEHRMVADPLNQNPPGSSAMMSHEHCSKSSSSSSGSSSVLITSSSGKQAMAPIAVTSSSEKQAKVPTTEFVTVPASSEDATSSQCISISPLMEFHVLMDRFHLVIEFFVKSLESSEMSIGDIKAKLIDQIGVFRLVGTVGSTRHSLLEGASAELGSAITVRGFFQVLKNYCSWFNYELLDTLAQQMKHLVGGPVIDVRMLFTDKLHHFLKWPVKMLPPITHSSQQLPGFVELVVSFSSHHSMWERESRELHMLKSSLAKAFSAEMHALLLTAIDQKRNEVRCLLAESVASNEFPPSGSSIRDWKHHLSDWPVVEISCGRQEYSLGVNEEEEGEDPSFADPSSVSSVHLHSSDIGGGVPDDDDGRSWTTTSSGYGSSVTEGPEDDTTLMPHLHIGTEGQRVAAAQTLQEVCRACLSSHYQRRDLLEYGCFATYGAHDGVPFVQASWDSRYHMVVEVRPLPLITLRPGSWFSLCRKTNCNSPRCTYAHNFPELKQWNKELEAKRSMLASSSHVSFGGVKQQQHPLSSEPTQPPDTPIELYEPPKIIQADSHNYRGRNEWKMNFTERVERTLLVEKEVAEPLTTFNYRDKFYNLLCYEEKEHIDLLTRRCDSKTDAKYTLVVSDDTPVNSSGVFLKGHKSFYEGHNCITGYVLGMTVDQIAYATQASEALFFVDKSSLSDICRVDIPYVNYRLVSKKLFLSLSQDDFAQVNERCPLIRESQYSVSIEFEVKHSYFDTLHRAVVNVPQHMIRKLLPTKDAFVQHGPRIIWPCRFKKLKLDNYQMSALQAIVQSTPLAPVIIAGPFGSGKTMILARATYQLIEEGLQLGRVTRILVCAHHSTTTQTDVLNYLQPVYQDKWHRMGVKLVQMDRQLWSKPAQELYKSIHQLREESLIYKMAKSVVLVTTFMSSMQLWSVLGSYFTHILLDEAAQVREPEAIAPLSLATKEAKVVVTGDTMQVGPALLVLGKEAQKHGLSVSLLERLKKQYESMGSMAESHLKKLNINYRCHASLMQFLSELFYDSSLMCHSVVEEHPKACFPLIFCCSDTSDRANPGSVPDYRPEIQTLLEQLQWFLVPWPAQWGQRKMRAVCVISSTRPQLNLIRKKLSPLPTLNEVRLLPTYQLQGHECRAVFLATGEPLDEKGCSYNPTKSLCNPYVFNTALSRAKSLVVAVGNPFTLLRVEEIMGKGTESHDGFQQRSWKKYIRTCLEKGTFYFSAAISKPEQVRDKLKKIVGVMASHEDKPSTRHHSDSVEDKFRSHWSYVGGHKGRGAKPSSNWQDHPGPPS